LPKHAAEVNAIQALFQNLHAICHLFATVAVGWIAKADVLTRAQIICRSKVVRSGILVISFLVGLSVCTVSAVAAGKDQKKPVRAEVLQKLIDCRAIRVDAERLACYETQTAKIDDAEAKRDLVIIDRDQATKARKEDFGLPSRPLIVGTPPALGEGVTDVTSKIRTAKLLNSNRWLFVLEDGARWYQAESKPLRDPKPGQSIRIRKGSLGGFLANIDGQPATRVRRIDQPGAN
jgi:hypothetical protein